MQKSGCRQQKSWCAPGAHRPMLVATKRLQKVRVCSLETKVQQMETMRFTSEMSFSSEWKFGPELKAAQGRYKPCC